MLYIMLLCCISISNSKSQLEIRWIKKKNEVLIDNMLF